MICLQWRAPEAWNQALIKGLVAVWSVLAYAQTELDSTLGKRLGPPYDLSEIRRLSDSPDAAATAVLREAFAKDTQREVRLFAAAGLVRRRHPDRQYFDFLKTAAQGVVKSDLPYSDSAELDPRLSAWAQDHHIAVKDTLHSALLEMPRTMEAVGEAADKRFFDILLKGLGSRNSVVVRVSAFGLARLNDRRAVVKIVEACQRLNVRDRQLTAKALLYFDDSRARRAAQSLIADEQLLRRWIVDVERRGWAMAMLDRAIDGIV